MEKKNFFSKVNGSPIWKFLNSNFVLLVLGGIITFFFTIRFQEESKKRESDIEYERRLNLWQRDKDYEVMRRDLTEKDRIMEELSDRISKRFFQQRNIHSNIKDGKISAANENWKIYFSTTVQEWNIRLYFFQYTMDKLTSSPSQNEATLSLYNPSDDKKTKYDSLKSIHGKFSALHDSLYVLLKDNMNKKRITKVGLLLDKFDAELDSYLYQTSDALDQYILKKGEPKRMVYK